MTNLAWNYATMWESVADAIPQSPAVIQGSKMLSWKEFDSHADAVAATLLNSGMGRHAKLAVYMLQLSHIRH